jgi:hypothetical protein
MVKWIGRIGGAIVATAMLGVLFLRALADVSSYAEFLYAHLPLAIQRFATNGSGILTLLLAGFVGLWWALRSTPETDLASLYEANTQLRNQVTDLQEQLKQRHLTDEQIRAISRVSRAGLQELRDSLKAKGWPEHEVNGSIYIEIYAGESDRETITYRKDFEKAFLSGGFDIALGELINTAAYAENEPFVDAIAVLKSDPANVVRPFVLQALREARLPIHETEWLPQHVVRQNHGPSGKGESRGAILVIGPRG